MINIARFNTTRNLVIIISINNKKKSKFSYPIIITVIIKISKNYSSINFIIDFFFYKFFSYTTLVTKTWKYQNQTTFHSLASSFAPKNPEPRNKLRRSLPKKNQSFPPPKSSYQSHEVEIEGKEEEGRRGVSISTQHPGQGTNLEKGVLISSNPSPGLYGL